MSKENENVVSAEVATDVDMAQAQTLAVQQTSKAVEVFDFDALTKSLEDVGGIVLGEIGVKVSRTPMEKYKASTQKLDRISFITNKVIGVKTHYIEGSGSILCNGKKCCELSGTPSVRYLFPIVVYNTDQDGNVVSNKVEVKVLSAGEDLYKTIITNNKAQMSNGGISAVDVMVTCTDDQYQKITLTPCGPAVWRKSSSVKQFVGEKMQQDGEFIYMAVARKVDEATMLQLLGVDSVGGTSGTVPSQSTANTNLDSFFTD